MMSELSRETVLTYRSWIVPMSTATPPLPSRHKPSHPTVYRETAAQATLRSDDSDEAISLQVTHDHRQVTCELRRAGTLILAGEWSWQLTLAGSPVAATKRWTSICSEVNDQAEYLELRLALDNGCEIERQIFLARRERFLFLADAVKIPSVDSAEYRMTLPLAAGMGWESPEETQEGHVCQGRRRIAQVLPLSLPEWPDASRGGLDSSDDQLVLTMPFRGQRLHAALFVDLNPRRLRRPVTWRHLTVAESLLAVPDDVAVGYRVQIGKAQWLLYRSLGARGNRTVLGQNLSTEFVVARFPPTGLAEKLLEIE